MSAPFSVHWSIGGQVSSDRARFHLIEVTTGRNAGRDLGAHSRGSVPRRSKGHTGARTLTSPLGYLYIYIYIYIYIYETISSAAASAVIPKSLPSDLTAILLSRERSARSNTGQSHQMIKWLPPVSTFPAPTFPFARASHTLLARRSSLRRLRYFFFISLLSFSCSYWYTLERSLADHYITLCSRIDLRSSFNCESSCIWSFPVFLVLRALTQRC